MRENKKILVRNKQLAVGSWQLAVTKVSFFRSLFSHYLIITLALFLSSCGKEAFFDDSVEIPNHSWKQSDMIQFKVDVSDTVSKYDFFVNIRHTKSYAYSNLYVFFHTTAPDGRKQTDTIEFPMADPEGNYVGDVSGGLVMNRIIIKRDVRFPKSGNYVFVIEQAMRDKELAEITDVGLTLVEKQ